MEIKVAIRFAIYKKLYLHETSSCFIDVPKSAHAHIYDLIYMTICVILV